MDPVLKAKWVAALRSGAYLQGRGQLRTGGADSDVHPRYCCLGVLCEVAGVPYSAHDPMPPAEWTGHGLASYVKVGLASLNDDGWSYHLGVGKAASPWSFAQLADFIEERL